VCHIRHRESPRPAIDPDCAGRGAGLAFEGDSQVTWFEGNFEAYEEHRHALLGDEADRPHRITYKKLTRT
jgi:hypothetical protein